MPEETKISMPRQCQVTVYAWLLASILCGQIQYSSPFSKELMERRFTLMDFKLYL